MILRNSPPLICLVVPESGGQPDAARGTISPPKLVSPVRRGRWVSRPGPSEASRMTEARYDHWNAEPSPNQSDGDDCRVSKLCARGIVSVTLTLCPHEAGAFEAAELVPVEQDSGRVVLRARHKVASGPCRSQEQALEQRRMGQTSGMVRVLQLLKFVYVKRSAPVPLGAALPSPPAGVQAACMAELAVACAIVASQAMNLVVQ